MKILLLGGTSEARALAEALGRRAEFAVTVSLAGRTAEPLPQGAPVRRGGFGGAQGLARYLSGERVDLLIDATHPYAAAISVNAARAAKETGVKLIALRRPPWRNVTGDNWVEVDGVEDAMRALGPASRRVFLALGRNGLRPFASAPQHSYLIRSVDPIDPPLGVPQVTYITARGPFSESEDRDLLVRHNIEVIVAKNSGGEASYGKIAAARALQRPVIMLKRPALPEIPSVATVEEALGLIDHALTLSTARGV